MNRYLFEKLKKALRNPSQAMGGFARVASRNPIISDRTAIAIQYRTLIGKWPDLDNPVTFNEKLQWLKLHDRNPQYTIMVDKFRSKEWVAETIGDQYVVPVYQVWENVEDVDVDKLPNRFVLKTNHDQGGVIICRDKDHFDLDNAKKLLALHMKRNLFWYGREWPYLNVKPLIFAEKYLEPTHERVDNLTALRIVDGQLGALHMKNRIFAHEASHHFFNDRWHQLSIAERSSSCSYDVSSPLHFEQMKRTVDAIADVIPVLDITFYESTQSLYFGELVISPGIELDSVAQCGADEIFDCSINLSDSNQDLGWLFINNHVMIWIHKGSSCVSGSEEHDLTDYKVLCFSGIPKFIEVHKGRSTLHTQDVYDASWNLTSIVQPDTPCSGHRLPAPEVLDEMLECSSRLSEGLAHLRVDWYVNNGQLKLGELTFYDGSGYVPFSKVSDEVMLGDLINLKLAYGD